VLIVSEEPQLTIGYSVLANRLKNLIYPSLTIPHKVLVSVQNPTNTPFVKKAEIKYLESIDVVMQPVIDLVRTLHPSKIWEDMSPLFYTTFWTLSMNDCFVPSTAYEKQRASLKQKLNALDENTELSKAKQKKEKEKIMIMLDKLYEEENKQKDHVNHVKARFEKEKEFWFPQSK